MKLPFRHLSIRVPWHDRGWDGTICKCPKENNACLCLPGIREQRDDEWEEKHCGKHASSLGKSRPPCLVDRGAFMSNKPVTLYLNHKLKHDVLFEHMQETELELPPYSAPALPFRWVNRETVTTLNGQLILGYDPDSEPKDGWKADSDWVLNPDNQIKCLDSFFSAIEPGKSLCFFYAKQVPFAETSERILLGVGWVKPFGKQKEYIKGNPDGYGAWIWERPIPHSIRPDFEDGFLLPYHALLAKAAEDTSINPEEYVALAPPDRRSEFSYATEHVTNDAAIAALVSCRDALIKMARIVPGPWQQVLSWINDRHTEVCRTRGPYPGLGSVLTAFGMPQGAFVAAEITRDLPDAKSPWAVVDEIFQNPKLLPVATLRCQITPSLQTKFQSLKSRHQGRLDLLRLLSRFEITADQARTFYVDTDREQTKIEIKDADILQDPYQLFHTGRRLLEPISFWTIDRGVYPQGSVAVNHPLQAKSQMTGPDDPRRVCALAVHTLQSAEAEGHSVLPRMLIEKRIREMSLEPPCPVDGDLLDAIEQTFEDQIVISPVENERPIYQLTERADICLLIQNLARRIEKMPRHNVSVDWRNLIDKRFGPLPTEIKLKEVEELARAEKTAALKELAESRFTVLLGPAGTGKTALLSVFCNEHSIKGDRGGNILLLAPTGKASVRLTTQTGIQSQTIAQFLRSSGRYDAATMRYCISDNAKRQSPAKTIIVDESSMLTEDQLAALLDEITNYDRIILVGDPRQLPPIGVGRPFMDLVMRLQPENVESKLIRIGSGYAELTVRCRYKNDPKKKVELTDLELAECFSGRQQGPGDDEIFDRLAKESDLGRLRMVSWDDVTDLKNKLFNVLSDELSDMQTDVDMIGLGKSLGGSQSKDRVYFNWEAAAKIESWQVLAPVRNLPGGTMDINRFIQKAYRLDTIQYTRAKQNVKFRIPRPMGAEEIVYGDKVINNKNTPTKYVKPLEHALQYVANGEIGIVVGQVYRDEPVNGGDWLPSKLQVVFSSQQGFAYTFTKGSFREEGSPQMELAYAITVHKAQGSEFGVVVLVLPTVCPTMSREMLYTALTRQKDRIVILHQGAHPDLRKYTSSEYSEVSRRFTNLFAKPKPVTINDRVHDGRFIHTTPGGLHVESKSEVIVATALEYAEDNKRKYVPLTFRYNQEMTAFGETRWPDFVIEDQEAGKTYYWEHCGMLNDASYARRWERKKKWYARQGITIWDPQTNPDGRLIVSEDGPDGEIRADVIREMVKTLFGR